MIRTNVRPKPADSNAAEALYFIDACGLASKPVQASKQGVPTMNQANQVEEIEKLATRVFGNADKANAWLRKPMKRFSGKSPLEAATDESNAQAIRELLHGLDHCYLV